MAVAAVGKGTVSTVLPVITVARAWAIKGTATHEVHHGRPKPRFAKPVPVTVKLAGGAARSTVLGVMALTLPGPGPGRVSVTVSGTLPISVYVKVPVWT